MELSSAKRGMGKMAATLGILQGTAWTFMSLLAIILHYWEPKIHEATTYGRLIESILYYKFIVSDGTVIWGSSFIISPTNFNIIMWVYFIFSVLWTALSFDQYTAIHSRKRRQIVVMRIWGMATLILSAVDLAFVVFLAIDYADCADEGSVGNITEMEHMCYLSNGIMLTLAARGFTLWLINVAFSIILIWEESPDIVREDVSDESLYATIPRAKLASIPVYQQY